ncbi:uncharacterized protein METZ01_LOCUS461719, partial [marine metagenome]
GVTTARRGRKDSSWMRKNMVVRKAYFPPSGVSETSTPSRTSTPARQGKGL